MSRILTLTKVFIKSGFGEGGSFKTKKKKNTSKALNTILFIILFGVIGVSIIPLMNDMYESLVPINQQGMILGLGFNLVSMIIFIFGIMTVISVFYFGKDIQNLLSMPLKPYEITISKLITSVIYQYAIAAIFLIPIIGVYGVNEKVGILYWIEAVIIFIILPIIPIVYSSIISILLMSFTSLSKHKDAFKMIVGILSIGLAIGINLLSTNINNGNSQQLQQMIMEGNNSLLGQFSLMFPTVKLGVIALTTSSIGNSMLNLFILIVLSLIAVIIFSFIANKLYFKGAVGASESYGKREKLQGKKLDKGLKENSKIEAYIKKELIMLVRTPTYFINCISLIVLMPVCLMIPILSSGGISETIKNGKEILLNESIFYIVIAVTVGVSMLFSSMNPTAATSISREGQDIYVNKYLPVSYYTQLKAKLISSILLNMITFIVLIGAGIYIGMPINLALVLLIITIEACIFTGALGILFDLISPKLDWEDEQKAVKQNFNYMKSFLISIIISVPLVIGIIKLSLGFIQTSIIIIGVLGILDIIIMKILKGFGVNKFSSLGD